eukprot:CAMPEP_0119303188 /NCGR_PEP_ID=MMETSP1333-20130426/4668_1 /TAXON_ID=418940 /ORGANISM="Scyphosphaera apsteinii, Strain RCC1455" /LENGTH=44 /DNA_ID= /DNA_START= /DNA_END= /DNA_ORIENTATION=
MSCGLPTMDLTFSLRILGVCPAASRHACEVLQKMGSPSPRLPPL